MQTLSYGLHQYKGSSEILFHISRCGKAERMALGERRRADLLVVGGEASNGLELVGLLRRRRVGIERPRQRSPPRPGI